MKMQIPLAISVLMHVILLFFLQHEPVNVGPRHPLMQGSSLEIRLVSPQPPRSDNSNVREIATSDIVKSQSVIEIPSTVAGEVQPASELQDVESDVEGTRQQSQPARVVSPVPLGPDIEDIRRGIAIMTSEQRTVTLPSDCTLAQQHSLFFDCPENQTTSLLDYKESMSFPRKNRLPDSRARQAIPLIVAAKDTIAANLLAAGVAAGDIERITSQLEAAAATYSETGNEKLDALLDQQYRNDATWQLMKSVLEPH